MDIEAFVAREIQRQRRDPGSDLYIVLSHALAAGRRGNGVMRGFANFTVHEDRNALMRITGDAGEALLSLYLAADAADRYCRSTKRPAPEGLASILDVSRSFRDAMMHWDDKKKQDPDRFLVIGDVEAVLVAPEWTKPDEKPSRVSVMHWRRLTRAARTLARWAEAELDAAA